eukprot:TRINITY_DN4119_c0_g1_i1.p1 TRINITY_DN4119_c0_g1~~TRINITY_DN4119_c0_g1_i1.p1  ORF type:complete len:602 (-),score=149.06 TRINITY_DN4119_c0_g1_i1:64-1869(-)
MSTLVETHDTQEANPEYFHQQAGPAPWGRLVSLHPQTSHIELIKDEVIIGRRPGCDYILKDPRISGVHFRLSRIQSIDDKNNVYIEDCSTNGTWINSKVLGKGRKTILRNTDKVSLASRDCHDPAFMFCINNGNAAPVDDMHAKYDVRSTLGTGNFSTVKLCLDRSTGEPYAVKVMDKKKFWHIGKAKDQMMAEVTILQNLQHPNIIRVMEVIDTPRHLYIILELARGGELFDLIREKGKCPEKEAKAIFKQILTAVGYLHSQNVTHRDLKPENILLENRQDPPVVKISDFGLAKVIGGTDVATTLCGTPMYVAPEVLGVRQVGEGPSDPAQSYGYGKEVDAWSAGCILYVMLAGRPPFLETAPLFEQIKNGQYSFADDAWRDISSDAQDLVSRLMRVDPHARLTIPEALAHPWFGSSRTRSTRAPTSSTTHTPTPNTDPLTAPFNSTPVSPSSSSSTSSTSFSSSTSSSSSSSSSYSSSAQPIYSSSHTTPHPPDAGTPSSTSHSAPLFKGSSKKPIPDLGLTPSPSKAPSLLKTSPQPSKVTGDKPIKRAQFTYSPKPQSSPKFQPLLFTSPSSSRTKRSAPDDLVGPPDRALKLSHQK